jgi:transcriptional regulator with XRE-family HTH domain
MTEPYAEFFDELMGLPPLLRAWRSEAGRHRGLGRPLTQRELVDEADVSERWYRKLESGKPVHPDPVRLGRVATTLQLDRSQTATLHLYAARHLPALSPDLGDAATSQTLGELLEDLLPFPAWISTATWDILGYNASAAAWFPWMHEPGANLVRWFCLSPEARTQILDWPEQTAGFLGLLRYARAQHPEDPHITALISEVLSDPDCHRIWTDRPQVTASRSGIRFSLMLPHHNFERVDVHAYILHPADNPTHRLAFITRIPDPEDAPDLDRPALATPTGATAHAGHGAISLPVLSAHAGDHTRLALSPTSRTVTWASRRSDGRWAVADLTAYTTLIRLADSVTDPAARAEYTQVARAALPENDADAITRIDALQNQLLHRMHILTDIRNGLAAAGSEGDDSLL